MSTTTMNAIHGTLTGARSSGKQGALPTLSMAKFLQQRASLPEMPEQESHMTAFTGIALRLAAAAVPVSALAWLSVAG
jgi:hypothetical protein